MVSCLLCITENKHIYLLLSYAFTRDSQTADQQLRYGRQLQRLQLVNAEGRKPIYAPFFQLTPRETRRPTVYQRHSTPLRCPPPRSSTLFGKALPTPKLASKFGDRSAVERLGWVFDSLNRLLSTSTSSSGIETLEIDISCDDVNVGCGKDLFLSTSEKFVSLRTVVLSLDPGMEEKENLESERNLTLPYVKRSRHSMHTRNTFQSHFSLIQLVLYLRFHGIVSPDLGQSGARPSCLFGFGPGSRSAHHYPG
jgi:hypothetical protein